jgi:hypothetical protein
VYLGCSGYAGKGRPHVAECVRLEMFTSHYLQCSIQPVITISKLVE